MFIDSHAHLEMARFENDRNSVLERARTAGVEAVVAVGSGTGPGSLRCGIELAELGAKTNPAQSGGSWPRLYATIGIHPHEAKLATDSDFAELQTLAKNPHVIAWGEIGLDYFYDHSPRDVQQAVFIRQMELARDAQLPIVIHCRPSEASENAWDDCLHLLREHWAGSGLGGVLHCFTGTAAHARTSLNLGFMISFAGNITFSKAQNIRDVARDAPADRILIETDSPFLAPVPHRGKRNEPAFVVEVARQLAQIRGASLDQIAEQTSRNFYDFFELQVSNLSGAV